MAELKGVKYHIVNLILPYSWEHQGHQMTWSHQTMSIPIYPLLWISLAYLRSDGFGSWKRVLLPCSFYISCPLWALYFPCFWDLPWEEITFIQTRTLRSEYDNGHKILVQFTNSTVHHYQMILECPQWNKLLF